MNKRVKTGISRNTLRKPITLIFVFVLFAVSVPIGAIANIQEKDTPSKINLDTEKSITCKLSKRNNNEKVNANMVIRDYTESTGNVETLIESINATVDNTPPSITSLDPSDGAVHVAVTTTVEVVFSEDMDTSTINASTFLLQYASTSVPGTVSYDSLTQTAIFIPAADLATDTTYTATVTTGVTDLAGNSIIQDKVWSFTTTDTIAPTTTLDTTPTFPDGDNGWFRSAPTITLTTSEPAVTRYQWNSTTGFWDIYSSPFCALNGQNTLYYYSRDVYGNTESIKTAIFKVDRVDPTSSLTDPREGQRIKGASYIIRGTSSDTNSLVSLVEVSINGGANWLPTTNTGINFSNWEYIWSPASDGDYNLKSRAVDNAGNIEVPGAGISVTVDNSAPDVNFTNPLDGAIHVAVTTTVDVVFSEDMDSSSVNTSTFLLHDGTTYTAGTVSYDSTTQTAIFIPAADLATDTTYTATVTTGVTDLAGNSIIQDKVWSFTTEAFATDATAPSTITDLSASDRTSTSITLSWTAPGDDGSTGTATEYDIRYSTLPIVTPDDWAEAIQIVDEPYPLEAGNGQSYTVGSLSPETSYYFAIKTRDEVSNESLISNVLNAYTLIVADITKDGTVNIFDLVKVGIAFGSSPGDPNWDPEADLKNDGVINIFDLVIVGKNFNRSVPPLE